jgi:hypothetical protein
MDFAFLFSETQRLLAEPVSPMLDTSERMESTSGVESHPTSSEAGVVTQQGWETYNRIVVFSASLCVIVVVFLEVMSYRRRQMSRR